MPIIESVITMATPHRSPTQRNFLSSHVSLQECKTVKIHNRNMDEEKLRTMTQILRSSGVWASGRLNSILHVRGKKFTTFVICAREKISLKGET